MDKAIQNPATLEVASTGCDHIRNPAALPPVGEGNQKSILLPEDIYWRAVKFSGPSTDTSNQRKAGQSRSELANDTIRDRSMERCHRSLEKSNQQNEGNRHRQKKKYATGDRGHAQYTLSPSATPARRTARRSLLQETRRAMSEECARWQRLVPWANRRVKSTRRPPRSERSSKFL
jgi:hypothetical protein